MRILIIDDEELIGECLLRVALSRGHSAKVEKQGPAGLKTWQEFKPHLVFLDVLIPGLDGPSLLQKAGKTNNEKVVMMSAHRAFSETSLPYVDLFLRKPFPNIIQTFKQAEALVLNPS